MEAMNCPACQTPNRPNANFCKHCGSMLMQTCPRCGAHLPDGANFCDHCGLRLVDPAGFTWWRSPGANTEPLPAPAAPEAEPRPAQVLPPSPKPTPAPLPAVDAQLQQYIPRELLAKLERARTHGEMVGERRVVTMLFCDVKGSTAAAEQLDPEDWSEIINGAFEHMIRPVYKYEGTVARLMGDAILAFFGAPIAHEDDPHRAVLAGLDIVAGIGPFRENVRQRYGLDFDVRVGINTGLVVVGSVGSDLRMEYTALGDAINLAARMEQTAKPGTVQVAYETFKLVKPLFEFEELGGVEVKGKSEPVSTYRVVAPKTVSGRSRGIEGLHAEIVGRDEELRALTDVLAGLKQGVGQIVCVLGEAGIGKSRLIGEKKSQSALQWFEITSLSYEANQAYALLQRLIRLVDEIPYTELPQAVRQKLASLVETLPLGAERRSRARQVFEALFGLASDGGALPLESETFKRELVEAMKGWFQAHYAKQPAVLVFDDMHWADSASVELLLHVLPLTEQIPIVLLCALRAERQSPAWKIKTSADDAYLHRYTEIMLRPLSNEESNELLNRLLSNPDLPDRLRASILEKAGGNPFFIEEVVRTLIDSGVLAAETQHIGGVPQRRWKAVRERAEFAIPDTLQSLLAARIDRLEEATRGTLQMASVIGRSFYHRVLQAVDEEDPELEKHLATLVRLDMIREAARVPEIEYAFRNPLAQEAVYKTILLKRRREFHCRVGEAMETLFAGRLEGMYGLLAYHFAQAGQQNKAVQYFRMASQQAVSLYAYDDAIQNINAALDFIKPDEKSEVHLVLLEELADVYRLLRDGEQSIAHYQQALHLFQGLEDLDPWIGIRLNRKILQVVSELKWSVRLELLQHANQIRLAARLTLEESLRKMESQPPNQETVRGLVVLSTDAWRIQEPPDWIAAQDFAQAAVKMAEQLGSPVDLSQALGAYANVLEGRSLLREHLAIAQQRLEICREPQFGDVRETIDALRGVGAALMFVGESEQAIAYLQEAENLAVRVQVIDQQANAIGLQVQCLYRLDRWDEVIALEDRWRDLERRYTRERVGETCFFVALSASVHALRGEMDKSQAYTTEAYDYMVSMSGQPEGWQRNQFY
jgi:class 3 adenylate cyclase